MYKEHSSFLPVPDDTIIWRFMDFSQFYKMLEDKSLFFSVPSEFNDPWEAHIPRILGPSEGVPMASSEINELAALVTQEAREDLGVNCWHINNFQSEAFWRIYGNRAIGIQSTFQRLKASFRDYLQHNVYIGKVEYIDYDSTRINIDNFFNGILRKRKSFEHERELRAVIWQKEFIAGAGSPHLFESKKGQNVSVNLSSLIERVYVNPFGSDWFLDVVRQACFRHGLSSECERSNLLSPPSL